MDGSAHNTDIQSEGTEVVAEEANTEQMEDLVNQVVQTAEIAELEVEAETAEKAVEITDTEMEVNLETYSAKKIETVHAVAIFENLTFNGVAQDDLKSLEKFVLVKNIQQTTQRPQTIK